MTIILGSQSPRRKEILGYFSLPFIQVPSHFDEDSIPFTGDPIAYATLLSTNKAKILSEKYPDAVVITADTVVYKNPKIYGKPKDEEDGVAILSELVGQWHSVFTSITVIKNGREFSKVEETKVLLNDLNESQIRHYLTSLECLDKAGAFAIQMSGGLIVKKIEGCYYNVMGLPINTLHELLKLVGIELWDYL